MIVLVTGGNGFLGTHIVKLLLEKVSSIQEIRVFDLKTMENADNSDSKVPVVHIQGDITNPEELEQACQGVEAVFHCASLIYVGINNPNIWNINVKGTENIINACIEHSIPYLIYTSTIDVVLGEDDIIYGNETLVPSAKRFLFGDYGLTKHKAETMILEANKRLLKNGELLRTLALRPTLMYGEGDITFIPQVLKSAKSHGGITYRVGNGHCKSQLTYIGNVAWAHIAALQALQKDTVVSGEAYFITDDTPLINIFNFLIPFFKIHNCCVSDFKIPFWPLYFFLTFVHFILNLLGLLYIYERYFPNRGIVVYCCRTIFFNREKARLMLNYKPIYSSEEAMKYTLDWFSNNAVQNIQSEKKKD